MIVISEMFKSKKYIYIFCRAAPMALGNSQAMGPIGAIAAGLCHTEPGIEPVSSWIPERFVSAVP